jgi:hypothetical protein
MTHRRHFFHTEGMTDLNKIRAEAKMYAKAEGVVVVHRHPYQDHGFDGCPLPRGWVEAPGHEVFRSVST